MRVRVARASDSAAGARLGTAKAKRIGLLHDERDLGHLKWHSVLSGTAKTTWCGLDEGWFDRALRQTFEGESGVTIGI